MSSILSERLIPLARVGWRPVLCAVPSVIVWFGLHGFVSPALAIGPSFDCAKVQTPHAQFICANPTLGKIDLEFVQAYYALRQQLGPDGWQSLKVEAINFLNDSASQCGISPSGSLPVNKVALQACPIQTCQRQASVWRSRLQGPALEEASRPIEKQIALQARLQTLGFLPQTETIDGVYGAATRTAIENWQQVSGLPVTGFPANVDAAKSASDSVTGVGSASQGNAPVSSAARSQSQTSLIPMADLAAIYARTRQ
jgi:hypothetical protein